MSDKNPVGKCFYCGNEIRFVDVYCEFCGKENVGWHEVSMNQCGNCHSNIEEEDKYCRVCGTKVGEGAYEPYQDLMECIYGPMPERREHTCWECGYKWTTYKMLDDEKFCPKCGGNAPYEDKWHVKKGLIVIDESVESIESEYVLIDSDITDILYSDTLKLTDESRHKLHTVSKYEVAIGRSTSCDITLRGSGKISRTHATFFYENKSWFLRDENSTFGTWLNDVRMESGKKYQLKADDVIDFAHSETLTFYSTKEFVGPMDMVIATDYVVVEFEPFKEQDDLIGKVINEKYLILQMIGEGGFFKTYLVMDQRIKKQWAMKILDKTDPKYSNTIHDMLMQEQYMTIKLEHPAIPLVVDIVEDEKYIFIVRDYVEGETLKSIVERDGAQTEENVREWGKQLCDILQYLHNLNPPHIYRDMKPANIVLRPDGNLKLIDFGIMRLYDSRKRGDTCALGTKGYAAPEQYGGMGQTDARTDIFGLGMTLHHLVTGVDPIEPPYEVKPIREVNPDLSSGLEYIVSKCIESNPDNRYQSCEDLYNDLCNYENLIFPSPKKGLLAKLFKKR